MIVKLEKLQGEIRKLRGEMEIQTHTLSELKKRQRELYLDIDRRLLNVERKQGGSSYSVSPGAPSLPSATAPETHRPAPTSSQAGGRSATKSTASGKSVSAKGGEQAAYQKAFDLLRELRYEAAIIGFRQFLKDFPDGRYAHIAQYWLAEANYAQRNFKEAIGDYQALVSRFPSSPKLAEALLKIGYSQYEMSEYAQSAETLNGLLKRYPGTTEAGQAQNLLKKIRLKQPR